jgi:hypothetical protein
VSRIITDITSTTEEEDSFIPDALLLLWPQQRKTRNGFFFQEPLFRHSVVRFNWSLWLDLHLITHEPSFTCLWRLPLSQKPQSLFLSLFTKGLPFEFLTPS